MLASRFLRAPSILAGILYAISIVLFILFFGGKTEGSEKLTGAVADESENS